MHSCVALRGWVNRALVEVEGESNDRAGRHRLPAVNSVAAFRVRDSLNNPAGDAESADRLVQQGSFGVGRVGEGRAGRHSEPRLP